MVVTTLLFLIAMSSFALGFLSGGRSGKQAPLKSDNRQSDSTGESSSNLINLLNFAQEVGTSSSNEKLRASADKLRQQFVRSFASRYDLQTGPMAGGAIASGSLPRLLSNINDESLLSEEALLLREVIMKQLNEVGGAGADTIPSNILFYNERLKNLREYRYALPFPRDCLQPVTVLDSSNALPATSAGAAAVSGADIMDAIRAKKLKEKRDEQQQQEQIQEAAPRVRKRDVFLNGLKSVGGLFGSRKGTNDATGADADAGAGADADAGAGASGVSTGKQNNLQATGSVEAAEAEAEAEVEAEAEEYSGRRRTRSRGEVVSRQQQVTTASIEETLRQAKKQRLESNPALVEQQQQDVADLKAGLYAEVTRWRAEASRSVSEALGLIASPAAATATTAVGDNNDGSGGEASYASWRAAVQRIDEARYLAPEPRRLAFSEMPPSAFTVQRRTPSASPATPSSDTGRVRTELASEALPNYAALLHACLAASLATYNIALHSVFRGLDTYVDANLSQLRRQLQDYRMELEADDLGYLTSLSAQAASALQGVLDIDTSTDEDLREARSNALGLKRARVLSRMAVGRLSQSEVDETIKAKGSYGDTDTIISDLTLDGVEVETVQSDKACGIITTDLAQGVTIVAFRGTLDPMDVVTDINFVSSPFDAINDRVGEAYRVSESLTPEYDSVEVHSGFLQSFESLQSQVQRRLREVAARLPPATGTNQPPQKHTLIFTGHSMGGALAQLAAAYFCEFDRFPACFNPALVTFATPAAGNADFVKYLNRHVGPYGGIRYWNEYDPVPYLATVVGYELGGIPIKMPLSKAARRKFKQSTQNPVAIAGGFDGVMPHVVYQVGSIVYTFPILGADLVNSESEDDDSSEEEGKERGVSYGGRGGGGEEEGDDDSDSS